MNKGPRFRDYDMDQQQLLPPDLRDWLPDDHLVYFLSDLVDALDLSPIYASYEGRRGGQLPYHPSMLVKLLLFGYCVGTASSRQLERQSYESVAFRVLTADQHPDHDTISAFRQQHLSSLQKLFVQVLGVCQRAGLVKLGHVALDGTKVRANASKHKAMSYDRMEKKESELEAEVERLLQLAEETDRREDDLYGRGKSEQSLPEELRFRQSRLKKIREAKAALDAEARARAEEERKQIAEKQQQAKAQDKPYRGKQPEDVSEKPDEKAQRNFTDPDSRIMRDGATKSFEQSYNCQAAVDGDSQIIVAGCVTQQANDKQQLKPVIEQLKSNTEGKLPRQVSADAGYFSDANLAYLEGEKIDGYVASGRIRPGDQPEPESVDGDGANASSAARMIDKLRTLRGRCTYAKRKEIVEPVFGQIKAARGFRQFLLRGLEKVQGEWDLICTGHNILKLFRSGFKVQKA